MEVTAMRNPCKDCIYFHKENRTCQSKNVPLAAAEKCLGLISCFVLHAKRTEALSDEAD